MSFVDRFYFFILPNNLGFFRVFFTYLILLLMYIAQTPVLCGSLFSSCQNDDPLIAYEELKVILCDLNIQNNKLARIHPLESGEKGHLQQSIAIIENALKGKSPTNFAAVYESEVSALVDKSCVSTSSFTGKISHDDALSSVNSFGVATVSVGSDSASELRTRESGRLSEWDTIVQKLNDTRLARTKLVRCNSLLITPQFLSDYEITIEVLRAMEDSDQRRTSSALAHPLVCESVTSTNNHVSLPLPSIADLAQGETAVGLSPRTTNVVFGPN